MARHLHRACAFGLLVALAGAAESQTEPPELPDLVIEPLPSPMVTEGETVRAGVKLGSVPHPDLVPIRVSFSVTGLPSGLTVTFRSAARSPSTRPTSTTFGP